MKFTDTLRFEAGVGFRQDNADDAPGYSQKDEVWVAYLQAMITMAPGVFLCPEVGYYDYMDNRARRGPGQPVVRRRQVADRFLISLTISITDLPRVEVVHAADRPVRVVGETRPIPFHGRIRRMRTRCLRPVGVDVDVAVLGDGVVDCEIW